MAAEQSGAAEFLPEVIHRISEPLLGIVPPGHGVQCQACAKRAFINVAQPQRDQSQADAPLPGLAQERGGQGINFGLEIGRFAEALGGLLFVHVIIADLYSDSANAFAVFADFGHELISHAAEGGSEEFLVRRIGSKSFLFAVGFSRRTRRDDRPSLQTSTPIGLAPSATTARSAFWFKMRPL